MEAKEIPPEAFEGPMASNAWLIGVLYEALAQKGPLEIDLTKAPLETLDIAWFYTEDNKLKVWLEPETTNEEVH